MEKIQSLINKLSKNPKLFIYIRKLLEYNFIVYKKIINNLQSNLIDNASVLDLGCGTGEFSVFFQDYNYTGIDIEPKYINYAKNNYDGHFELMDASCMLFENNSLDLIVVFGVFHHINTEKCLKIFDEMNRVLKKNGKIFIMEDVDVESKLDILGNFLRKYDKGDYIRKKNEYFELFQRKFTIRENYRVKSGLASYEAFII